CRVLGLAHALIPSQVEDVVLGRDGLLLSEKRTPVRFMVKKKRVLLDGRKSAAPGQRRSISVTRDASLPGAPTSTFGTRNPGAPPCVRPRATPGGSGHFP